MRRTDKKPLRQMLAIAVPITAFMMMSDVVKAEEVDLNIGAAAVLDSDEENKETDQEVLVTAGAMVDESLIPIGGIDEAEEPKEDEAEEQEENSSEGFSLVMANVDNSVNVREEPNEEAPVAGKLFKNCGATILEQEEGWTKVQSGNLTGWVSNDYLMFGEEAQTMVEEVGTLKATVITDALRVRKDASEDAGVYKLAENGERLTVVEELDGWVSVQVDKDTVGYVSAEFVSLEYITEHGKTSQEIADEERERERAKLSKNRGAVSTSGSDVALLAALIQAEAGNQPYEGKLAVGAVVMNRVRSGGYPNSIAEVITAPGQFPPATNGTVAAIAASGPSSSCMQAAQAAVAGQTNVGGALHFGLVGKAPGIVIGSHVFY